MDLNEYWQENKRFVMTVVGGLIVFWIGTKVIRSTIGSDLISSNRSLTSVKRDLKEARYQPRDLTTARTQNSALMEAHELLAASVSYPTRPEFQLKVGGGSAGNRYFEVVSRVRDDLLRRAGRRNIRITPDLGLPIDAPTRDDEIERHLDALDLIERVLNLAIDEGVQRIDKIEIKVDPGLRGRRGVGSIEHTRVKMKWIGASRPMLRVLAATQSPSVGPSILIEELEIVPERSKKDEARLEVTFLAPRLHTP